MKKLCAFLCLMCLTAALTVPASAAGPLECVNANSISLASAWQRKLAHSVAPPFPTRPAALGAPGGPGRALSHEIGDR